MSRALYCLWLAASVAAMTTGCDRDRATAPAPADTIAPAPAAAQKSAPADQPFSIEGAQLVAPRAGESAQGHVTIAAKAGYKLNADYPWKLTIDEADLPQGVLATALTVDKAEMAIEGARAQIPVSLTASGAGTFEVPASVSLSACEKGNEARCMWFRDEPVTLSLRVEPGT